MADRLWLQAPKMARYEPIAQYLCEKLPRAYLQPAILLCLGKGAKNNLLSAHPSRHAGGEVHYRCKQAGNSTPLDETPLSLQQYPIDARRGKTGVLPDRCRMRKLPI